MTHPPERLLFVTGRFAERMVRKVVAQTAEQFGFEYEVQVLGISVAALMTSSWLQRRLSIEPGIDRIILPGWTQGDLDQLQAQWGVSVVRGPIDIRELPQFLGGTASPPELDQYDIEILAEINHAPQLESEQLLNMAIEYATAGADIIDLGCIPGESWSGVGHAVQILRDEGFRVSIDSFERQEVEAAVKAGAELVLSCHAANREWLSQCPAELVAIPDAPDNLDSLAETVDYLKCQQRPFRIDPILEPLGLGFAASLERYAWCRRQFPNEEILMGVGNVTELAEADSAGLNLLLAAVCQEYGIRSILTTQVANWCRGAISEFETARRLVKYAVEHRVPIKRLGRSLLQLRDDQPRSLETEELLELAGKLQDPNFRIFIDETRIHIMNRDGHWSGTTAQDVFTQVMQTAGNIEAGHAFYLGWELNKAATALLLGKAYVQDEPLRWGKLQVPEHDRHGNPREKND